MTDLNLKKIFSDIPPMGDSRLILKKLDVSFTDDMYEYASLSKTTKYLSWRPHESKTFTKNYLKYLKSQYKNGEYFDWAITLRDTGKMIGTCGFSALYPEHMRGEIGYVINPDYWGAGIATDAAKMVISFAFEQLGLNRVEAKHIVGNDASGRVMEKLGMKKEGVLREYMFVKGSFEDICLYSITAADYFKQKYNI